MEADATSLIGAKKYQRTEDHNNFRNGIMKRPFASRMGNLELSVPKLRQVSYFPSFFELWRMWEKA